MRHAVRAQLIWVFTVCVLMLPSFVAAFPFGGMIGQIVFCYNNAIYTSVGPPNGGPFIWAPSTKTYQFGPPSHVGQWLLGLAAPPYYCLVSTQPVIVWAGILMTMEGSSSRNAVGTPSGLGGGFGNGVGNAGGGGIGSGGLPIAPGSGIGHVVVSEVYYLPDAAHGGKTEHQWIEVYNPTATPVDISRWSLQTASSTLLIPNGTILGASGYAIFAGTTSVRTLWNMSSATAVVPFPNPFPGLLPNGDHVYLVDTAGIRVDAVSYARDTQAFDPSVPSITVGKSILRKNLVSDTDTATDWVDTGAPNPGR